ADLAERFAQKGGEKFAGVRVTPGKWGEPLFVDALATLECSVAEETSGGTHYVFLAEVESGAASGGTPLAYFRGQFGHLELTRDQSAGKGERRPDQERALIAQHERFRAVAAGARGPRARKRRQHGDAERRAERARGVDQA